ncbi:MAG: ABC-F family ATP-binding cassette domain-containing protein [Planctomycetes bacterium]|nr:ABC-F family ATP-binding cassette domain-containing protein [Planctomycetota bacterium]
MALVALSHVIKHFGGATLLNDITLDIEPGMKVGIIGQNGTGKSTLLKIIAGALEPTDGAVFRQRGLTLAYQAQELSYTPGSTVFEEMRRVFAADVAREARLAELEHELAKGRGNLAEYERLQHEHHAANAYDLDRRIEAVLSGLGLPEAAFNQRIDSFSGGERNIIGLARIVLTRPQVMLLDEPSNHLDMDGIEWFIDFVRKSEASMVMVSHNRHMLDACVSEIWDLRSRKITRWAGNYSDYVRQKEEADALQERHYHAQQRMIKRLEFQARRLKDMAKAYDDPGQAKRAKALESRIEQMEKVEKVDRNENRFRASFGGGDRHGRIALSIRDFSFAFSEMGSGSAQSAVPDPISPGEKGTGTISANSAEIEPVPQRVIFSHANLDIEYGDRVALVGPNGSGKTTLFREILRYASWENETLRLGKSAKLGDYSQLHDVLDHSASLINWMCAATGLIFQPASELLHRFLFKREDLERPISTLSGGEKSRLQLARLVHAKVNFLMLDEPTNHLDIQACEQLEEMLEEFDGTLLIISHDRYFLDKLVTRVVEVRDQKLEMFDGKFAAWWETRHKEAVERKRGALQLHSQKGAAEQGKTAGAIERDEKKARQRELHRMRTQLRSLEEKIAKLETKQIELSKQLEAAFTGGGAPEALVLSRDFEALNAEIKGLYAQWENLAAAVNE